MAKRHRGSVGGSSILPAAADPDTRVGFPDSFDLGRYFAEHQRHHVKYPESKLSYFACPFYALEPCLYDGIRNSACQGWGFHDISALRDHMESHLPKHARRNATKNRKPGSSSPSMKDSRQAKSEQGKHHGSLPQISADHIDLWVEMRSNRQGRRGTGRSDQEQWWDIAKVALDCNVPEPFPPYVHLAFYSRFAEFERFYNFVKEKMQQNQVELESQSFNFDDDVLAGNNESFQSIIRDRPDDETPFYSIWYDDSGYAPSDSRYISGADDPEDALDPLGARDQNRGW